LGNLELPGQSEAVVDVGVDLVDPISVRESVASGCGGVRYATGRRRKDLSAIPLALGHDYPLMAYPIRPWPSCNVFSFTAAR